MAKSGGGGGRGGRSGGKIQAIDKRLGQISRRLSGLGGPKFPGTPEYATYQKLQNEQRKLGEQLIKLLSGG